MEQQVNGVKPGFDPAVKDADGRHLRIDAFGGFIEGTDATDRVVRNGVSKMTSASSRMLPVAPAPRTARSSIPLVGGMLDARAERAFQAAFDRSERAVIAAMEAHGEVLTYAHSYSRLRSRAPGGGFPMGLPAVIGASFAPPVGARLAAICSSSIIVATPSRSGASVRRIPLSSIRAVDREPRGAVVRLAGEEIVLDGLAHPKRFVDEARRCIVEDARRKREADGATPPDAAEALRLEACEVASIRRRLRERGWMLAVANDYRLSGEWHVFYSFSHPDGIAAKGEGTSDLTALRLAEADVVAKEAWLRGLAEKAA